MSTSGLLFPVTYEANRIVHLKLAEANEIRHPLAAFGGRPGTRAVVHPVTYPALYMGNIRSTTSLTDPSGLTVVTRRTLASGAAA